MRILNCVPTPGSNLYSVICYCGFPFNTAGDSRGRVKCPHCKREGELRKMVGAWKATPEENLRRLQEISAEARALYAKYTAIPEPDRVKEEGRAMERKLDEYYNEAKGILSAAAAAG